jgi:hypothetical protein
MRLFALYILCAANLATALVIGRVKYEGGGDWYSDPGSLQNLASYAARVTGMELDADERVVELDDPQLNALPLLYLTGHGRISLSDMQAERLRAYLEAGGFLHVDDNYGLDEHIRRELKRVFPEKELLLVPLDHPVYHSWFSFPEGLPKIHEHDNKPPAGYGIFLGNRLAVFYTHECDLGDGWEDASVHNDPEWLREKALQMGTNILVYALGGGPDHIEP